MNNNVVWAVTILLVVLSVCGTLVWLNYNSWTVRFEMDDNTRTAVESIEWDDIAEIEGKDCHFNVEYCYNGGKGIVDEDINQTESNRVKDCFFSDCRSRK